MNPLNLLPDFKITRSLFIHYVLLGVTLLASGALITTALKSHFQSKKIEQLGTDLTEKAAAVNQRDSQIESLEKARRSDAVALKQIEQARINLLKAAKVRETQLYRLEKTDEVVRNYLNTPIPDALGRMLNDSPTAAGSDKNDQP